MKREHASDFDLWMEEVDAAIEDRVGCESLDLPDFAYRDHFDNDFDPEEVADLAIENAGGF